MNRNRPYLNRFVKQKELDLTDIYHDLNMREIKPITTRLMEHPDAPLINNSKREMIKEVRDIEIERENKLLLGKIERVMLTKGNYSVARTRSTNTKANKSLNDILRRKQLESIESENKRFLMRLQSRKATMDSNKLRRDWEDNKSVIKRMANEKFNMTHFKTRDSRLRSFTSDRLFRNPLEETIINKMKTVDGQRMAIKVEFGDGMLKIVGDCCDQKDLKVIEIPKEQALLFIEKDCDGKMERLLEKLKYDRATETLYLLSETIEDYTLNPERERNKKPAATVPLKVHSTIEYSPKVGQDSYHYQTLSHRTSAPESKPQSTEVLRIPKKKTEQVKKSAQKLNANAVEAQKEKVEQSDDSREHQQRPHQKQISPHQAIPIGEIVVAAEAEENYNQQFQQSKEKASAVVREEV